MNDPQFSLPKIGTSSIGKDISKEAGNDRVKNVFFNIEKACLDEKVCGKYFGAAYEIQ